MRIAINALFLRPKISGGTETYVNNIVRRWYSTPATKDEFLLIANHIPSWWEGDRAFFKLEVQKASGQLKRIFREQTLMALRSKVWDAVFCPGYVGIVGARCPQVITIHDAYAWVHPKEAGELRTFYWRVMINLSIRRSQRIISVSQSTKRDLLKFTHLSEDQIIVIPEAGDHVPALSELNDVNLAIRSSDPYFLCIGIFKEIKNPKRLLEAFRKYRVLMKAAGRPACRLKLVGANVGPIYQELHKTASGMDGIDFCGRLDDSQLYPLLKNAYAFLFPSLYEGFGLPILEAQRLGCPVLTSNTSSMPEVAGGGAIFVDPYSIEDICEGMVKLHLPETRAELIQRGHENEKAFSWETASRQTLQVLISLCKPRQ